MAALEWDQPGERLYETGVENGVLYLIDDDNEYSEGYAWNGLTAVTESPSGAEPTPIYADNSKYITLMSAEEFGLTIEAYTYPDQFAECDGSKQLIAGAVIGQQPRKMFGLCYKTLLGNDIKNDSYGYKLHLIYGCLASPSEKAYQTVNDSPEATPFSWEVSTTPVNVTNMKPTSCIVVDSTKFVTENQQAALQKLLDALYGTDGAGSTAGTDPYLPLPDEVKTLLTPVS